MTTFLKGNRQISDLVHPVWVKTMNSSLDGKGKAGATRKQSPTGTKWNGRLGRDVEAKSLKTFYCKKKKKEKKMMTDPPSWCPWDSKIPHWRLNLRYYEKENLKYLMLFLQL